MRLMRLSIAAAIACFATETSEALVPQNSDQNSAINDRQVVKAADSQQMPFIRLSAIFRQRYELQVGRYRAGLSGTDDIFALRSHLKADMGRERLTATVELMDARVYGDDANTPLGTDQVNPLDILQAHLTYDFSDRVGAEKQYLRIGRQTMDLNSRRFMARNGLRNTINSFNGLRYHQDFADSSTLELFGLFTLGRRPNSRAGLDRNDIDFDEENFQQFFWGAHYDAAFEAMGDRARAEIALFGLHESDDEDLNTANRQIITAAARLFRAPKRAAIDWDFEGAYQFGERRASRAATDTVDQDVRAWFLHGEVGYSFDHDWNWRISAEFDYASGDKDPADGVNNRYDTLFGVRVRDHGNSGIFGPFARENMLAPGGRISFKKGRVEARVSYNAGHLASNRDLWRQARLQDASGQSGSFAGHDISGRMRFWAIPKRWRLQLNLSYFIKGDFTLTAPGASTDGDIFYSIFQSSWYF